LSVIRHSVLWATRWVCQWIVKFPYKLMVFELVRGVQFCLALARWIWRAHMETFMDGAAVAEIFLMSVILAVLMSVWAMRGMLWLMEGAGRPVRVRAEAVGRKLVMARVKVSSGQISLRTR
jgi:hypothetical protein